MTTAAQRMTGDPLARRPSAGRGAPAERAVTPVVLDHRADTVEALHALDHRGQAIAFVYAHGGVVGVVTVEDLQFARDWAGSSATVADAMTLGIVEVGRDTEVPTAVAAFGDGARRWLAARSSSPA